jgi:GntR family transcriptional repressor for pyruvate dehydrogenase complex
MSNPDARPRKAMSRVQVAPAFELAAEEIRRAIAMGRYGAGDRLPNERELSQQLGVARATLREATRALAAEGLLEVRRGAYGGIRVAEQAAQNPTALRARLRQVASEVDDILDLRISLESGAAHLAATRRTTDDLAALQEAFDRMQNIFDEGRMTAVSEFWRADIDFHTALATATRNDLLRAAVEDARIEFLRPLGHVFSTIQRNAHDGHLEMLEAIRDSDPRAAADAAREHIEITRRALHEMAHIKGSRRRAN